MTTAAALALGRILRLGSRPTQPGDIAMYERCRAIIYAELGADASVGDHRPHYPRDHRKGAPSD